MKRKSQPLTQLYDADIKKAIAAAERAVAVLKQAVHNASPAPPKTTRRERPDAWPAQRITD